MKNFCVRRLWERVRRAPCSRGFGVQSPSDYKFITKTLRGALPEAVCGALPSDEAQAKLCRLVYLVCKEYKARRAANLTGCDELDAFVRFARPDCDVSHATSSKSISSRPTSEQICQGQLTTTAADVLIADATKLSVSGSFQQSASFQKQPSSSFQKQPSSSFQQQPSTSPSTSLLPNDLFKNLSSPSRIIVANIHASTEAFRAWREITKHPMSAVSFDLYSSGVVLVDGGRCRAEYSLWF